MTSVRRPAPTLVALAAVLLGLRPVPPAVASATAEAVLVIDGKGDGHGVGMSQDGALAMGRAGATTDDILAKFYPGTDLATAGGVIGVRIVEGAATSIDVAFPDGGEVRAFPVGPQPKGFPVAFDPGGTATISVRGGAFQVTRDDRDESGVVLGELRLIAAETADTTTSPTTTTTAVEETTTTFGTTTIATTTPTSTAPTATAPTSTTREVPATTTAPAGPPPTVPGPVPPVSVAGGLWLVPPENGTISLPASGRRYRGQIEVGGSPLGGLQLLDHVDVEDYLRGMGEVLDPSWPAASLRAQAIAARTYALRATRNGGSLCADDRCQVYLGAGAEYRAMDEAVVASAGQVLTFGASLASAVYSASAGGVTATPREGFGTDSTDFPYLPSAPYEVSDPRAWSDAITLTDLGRRLDYPGHVRGVTISSAGPSGRVLGVVLDGDAGPRAVDGLRFASRLDLASTLFSIRTGVGEPTSTPGAGMIQAPPDAVASLPPLLRTVADSVDPPRRSTPEHVTGSALLLAAAACLLFERRRRRAARPSG